MRLSENNMDKFIKRLLDLLLALVLLIPGALVLLVGALWVSIVSPEAYRVDSSVRE